MFSAAEDAPRPNATILLDLGTFFRITPAGEFTTLYTFPTGSDDQAPAGKLTLGRDGNFYGVTRQYGVEPTSGTAYRITPQGERATLNYFDALPNGGLVQSSDGTFYGTTNKLGASGDTVFRLDGTGGLSTLHTFNGGDGVSVQAGLTLGRDGNLYGTTLSGGVNYNPNFTATVGYGTLFQITPSGVFTTLYNFDGDDGTSPNGPLLQTGDGLFYGTTPISATTATNDNNSGHLFALTIFTPPAFFAGEEVLTQGVYYLQFPNTDYFGYYTFLSDPRYLYHFDLGYEYVFDAADGKEGVYLYDFASNTFFYTSPTFPFPYLYDFTRNAVLYYYPVNLAGRYSSNPRYFYDFAAGQIITK